MTQTNPFAHLWENWDEKTMPEKEQAFREHHRIAMSLNRPITKEEAAEVNKYQMAEDYLDYLDEEYPEVYINGSPNQ